MITKIAIVGPESTGKTTLAKKLAYKFNGVVVEEFAREYLQNVRGKYILSDIENIAKGQLKKEQGAEKGDKNFIFCDTNLLVTKIWARHAFSTEIEFINQNYNAKDYLIHLLCNIDLPWEYDEFREHPLPSQREYLFNLYKQELQKSGANFFIISGTENERVKQAESIITANSNLRKKL